MHERKSFSPHIKIKQIAAPIVKTHKEEKESKQKPILNYKPFEKIGANPHQQILSFLDAKENIKEVLSLRTVSKNWNERINLFYWEKIKLNIPSKDKRFMHCLSLISYREKKLHKK